MDTKDKGPKDTATKNNPKNEPWYDFRERLNKAGVPKEQMEELFDRIRHERAEAEIEAAKLFYNRYGIDRLDNARFCDLLGDMVTRMNGVQVTMDGLREFVISESVYEGARLVIDDAVLEIRRLSMAFNAHDTLAKDKAKMAKQAAA